MKNALTPPGVMVSLLLFFNLPVYAQEWANYFETGRNVNFYEASRLFNEYWEARPIERGKGYKPFKRWEYYWESRIESDGSLPPAGLTEKEMLNYLASHPDAAASSANWISMGPSSSVGGYAGIGRLNCVAVHPSDPNTIYVGSAGGGLWRTTNGGSSWTCLTDNQISVLGVSDIIIEPTNPNTIYIATGDGNAFDNPSVGVRKSTDGGATWTNTGLNWSEASGYVIRRLIRHPSDANTLLLASNDGIYRSINAGVSWTKVQSGNFFDMESRPGSGTVFYASSNNAIFRSTDQGATWSSVFSQSTSNRIAIAVSPANPQLVVALCSRSSNSGFDGFYSSTDGGSNFFLRSSSPNLLGWDLNGSDTGGQGWYDLCVAVSPTDANTIFVGGVNTWKSTNGGVSWTINTMWYSTGQVATAHADKHDILFTDANTLYQANDGGIYRSVNGGTNWADISNGLVISQMYRLGGAQTSAAVLAGLQDNGTKLRSANGVWSDEIGGDGMECAIDPSNASLMYGTLYYGEILRSSNGGASWSSIKPAGDQGAWVTPFVLDPGAPQTIYMGYRDVYKTTNAGSSWTKVSTNLTGGPYLRAMAIAPSATNTLYVSADGNLSSGNRLFRSTNGGTSWTTLTNPTNVGRITYLAVHSSDANTLWAAISGYNSGQKVFKSTDGGSSWTNISGTLPNLPANCIIHHNGSANDGLYLAMDVGVYYRDNTMSDWQLYSNGMPNVEVTELEIQYSLGKIRAATYGRGMWESDLFSQPQLCSAPTVNQLSTSNLTTTAARLNCSTAGVNAYDWRYRAQGAANWIDLPSSSSNFVDLSGLSSSTAYEFQVAVQCGLTWSDFSGSASFSTLEAPCNAPVAAQLTAGNITSASARLNCSVSGVNAYDWRYRVQGAANWIELPSTTTNFVDLSGLLASVTYEFQAAVQCVSNWSAFSESVTFSTLDPPCEAPATEQLSVSNLGHSGARLNCAVSGVNTYDWRYRPLGAASWIDLPLTTTNYFDLSGLTSSTTYEFQASVQCAISWSTFSGSLNFSTTAAPCDAPLSSQISASDITISTARLNCAIAGAGAYDWRYRVFGSNSWTDLPSTTDPFINLDGLSASTVYEFQAAVQCGANSWSDFSSTQNFTTLEAPCESPAITDLSATNVSATGAQLNCAVSGVNAYDWRYRMDGSANWIDLPSTNTGLVNISGLAASTTYEFQAAVQCGNTWSDFSASANFSTPAPPCEAPAAADLSATNVSTTAARLNCAVSGAGAYDWRYRVQGSANWTDLPSTAGHFIDLIGLSASTTYEFQSAVQCGATWSNFSASANFSTPAPPCVAPAAADLSATNVSTTAARLNCAVSGAGAYDWRYRIQGSANWTDLPSTANNFTDLSGLSASTTYEFQAAVQCGATWSDFSPAVAFTTSALVCTAPGKDQLSATNVTATSAQIRCALTGVSTYNWRYRRLNARQWISLGSTETPFFDLMRLSEETTYEFQVAIWCGSNWSAFSNSQFFTTLTLVCNAPGVDEIFANDISASSARLNCGLSGADAYDWRYRRSGSNNWTNLPATTDSFTLLSGLILATAYEFQVAVKCGSLWSNFSATQSFSTVNPVCNAPATTQISASNLTATAARLNCSVSGVTAYDWRYRVEGASGWTEMASTSGNSINLSGLSPATTYEFQVAVQCGSSWSAFSNTASFSTLSGLCNAPSKAQLSVSNLTTTSVRLQCGVGGVNTYDWRYKASNSRVWIELPATSSSFYNLSGLIPGRKYEFQVAVQCGATWSAFSSSVTFTTLSNTASSARMAVGVYPVPANDQVSVEVSLPEAGPLSIRIYDIGGKLRQVIDQEWIEAGEHLQQFSVGNLPPGIYLLTVQSAWERWTERLVIKR